MTDHMLIMSFTPENGWSAPAIKPYGPLEIDPASSGTFTLCFLPGELLSKLNLK